MIYQCYPFKKDRINVFPEEPYKGFGLEPEVNKLLTLNCPELKDPFVRLQLTEYACFLWHWRNPGYDTDSWIGTTSYRQLEKFEHVFKGKKEVRDAISHTGVTAWGEYHLVDKHSSPTPITLEEQTERCHPGLNEYIKFMLEKFGYNVPDKWATEQKGFYANYWVMTKELFDDFMEFSWPMVEWSLENIKITHYYAIQPKYGTVSNQKATGYFMERLFLLWYLIKGITPQNPATPHLLAHGD